MWEKGEVLKTYRKHCEKKGRPIKLKELKDYDDLPSQSYIYKHIGNMKELQQKVGYYLPQARYKDKDFTTKKGLPLFCKECLHTDSCPYGHDLDKCKYAKEVG